MSEVIRRNKALSVNPLKASQPVGAALATLGFDRAIPMLHGSQGCTAFAKVYFVRHFREPIPLQTTAMDQTSSIMGADDNVIEGLHTIAEKSAPALITVLTTGLSETQGSDVKRCVKEFRAKYPAYNHIAVVAVNTPDFFGCLETGYAATLVEIIDELVPAATGGKPGTRPRQVNVLAGSFLTPGDLEHLRDVIEWFGLQPVFVPDVSDSLDGHLTDGEYSPVTVGGTAVAALATLGDAAATLVIGASLYKAADVLAKRSGVPDHRFDHLYGLHANDALMTALAAISGNPVPARVERQRAQLQDAMVDTHFMLGMLRVAIAADPDLLNAWAQLIHEMGGAVVAAVSAGYSPLLNTLPTAQVKLGDLEDLENLAREANAELLIGNSHAVQSAQRLGLPILRCGFPLYDLVGGYQKTFIGYAGARQSLFDLANLCLSHHQHHEIPVYRSIFSQKPAGEAYDYPLEAKPHDAHPTFAHC
ncbi:MAG: nitrogenase iron-molybdenum cofactor biosynthesis protein NifN [Methylococcaceae bacterium]|nr:MAG: nitrogenase iron-molybdenum cofactor biosynthesis protein NifN [Methylococcaceae bacterium]